MNKTHVSVAGAGAGFLAIGISLFFPKLGLNADQMAFIVGALPATAMGALAGLEVVFPKLVPVVNAVEAGAETPAKVS